MTQIELFTAALNLSPPWHIKSIRDRGVKFEYEDNYYPVYDHQPRSWKHLRFFQHACYLHARVPRVKTLDGKYRLVEVPWAQKGSSFTLLMELDVLSPIE